MLSLAGAGGGVASASAAARPMGRTGSKPPESDTNWPTYANSRLGSGGARSGFDATRPGATLAPVTNGDAPASPKPTDRALIRRAQETRERVIARLSDHFAHDALDVDEFERRVTVAQTSDNPADIEALLADLPDTGWRARTGRRPWCRPWCRRWCRRNGISTRCTRSSAASIAAGPGTCRAGCASSRSSAAPTWICARRAFRPASSTSR